MRLFNSIRNLTDKFVSKTETDKKIKNPSPSFTVETNSAVLTAPQNQTILNQPIIGAASVNFQNQSVTSGEILPWGVQAVWGGEDIAKRGNFASDTYAFVIDSGVSDKTGDINLASNPNWHRSWITGESAFSDANGHGTHVAGTIGALVNGKGVIGVAPGAQIVSLKVYDANLFSSGSTVAEAVNYATSIINSNNLDKSKVVINMSLSGMFDQKLNDAVINAANQGIRFSIAAGNDGKDVDSFSPSSAGNHPNVFTVSAVDSNYTMPFWSNWDRVDASDPIDSVDFAAPGVGVLSYYRDGGMATLSGTSMASPHVAGLLITGGVTSGGFVTPSYSNTSDPFAISGTLPYSDAPLTSIPTPVVPAPEPIKTYNLISPSTVDEGQSFKLDIKTKNVDINFRHYWYISGNGITADDLSLLEGSTLFDKDGSASVEIKIKADRKSEGTEVLKFELYDGTRTKVGEQLISIQDTSKTPPPGVTLWGTNGNDVITGTAGDDFLCGVSRTGTNSTSMGCGQIDILTGGEGFDTFLLGDLRGAFYDDGIKANHGMSDYVIIKDFTPGEDKVQLNKNYAYVTGISNGNLNLYLDLNRNRNLEISGVNRDELIAIFEGVTFLGGTDSVLVK